MDGFGQPLHLKSVYVDKFAKAAVVIVVKRLKVLATCRKYGTGKPSNSSAWQMDIPPTLS